MSLSGVERDGPPASIGINSVAAWLRAAREARGETLDEVAKVTRIGKNYLAAIEDADLCKLPSQAYTRGFIRLYASHLELSPEKALSMLDAIPTDSVAEKSELESRPQQSGMSLPPYTRSLILITVLISLLVSAYFLFKQPTPSKSTTQNMQSAPRPEGTVAVLPAITQKESATNSPPPPSPTPSQESGEHQGIVLRLKAVSDGKIHITIDDSVSQDYDLVTGDIVEWKAEDTIMLDLDNAASVEGELDGLKLAPFGEESRAAHLVLNADGIQAD